MQRLHADRVAAENADDVADENEAGQHQRRGENAGEEQVFEGIRAEGDEGVHLFGHAHGADLGGEGGADAAGDHEARHDGAKLARDGEGDDEGNRILGTYIGEAGVGLQGECRAGEDGGHADDGQRVIADLDDHAAELAWVIRRTEALRNGAGGEEQKAADSSEEREEHPPHCRYRIMPHDRFHGVHA